MAPRNHVLSLALLCRLLFACGSDSEPPPADAPQSETFLTSYSLEQIAFVIASSNADAVPLYPVELTKIRYTTVDVDGTVTQASGALAMPKTGEPLHPPISYQHGTVAHRQGVPSRMSQEHFVGVVLASLGYPVLMPDYLGLGDSPGLHPYVHAASEAQAVIDLLRATRSKIAPGAAPGPVPVFLTGYSQGGHATVATHRALEALDTNEFEVLAAAPAAGPYDLSGTMADIVLRETVPYGAPSYVPYLLMAYNRIYNLAPSNRELFRGTFQDTLPPLFDGTKTTDDISAASSSFARDLVAPNLVADLSSFADSPIRQALEDNDVYDWTPVAPVRFIHCPGDELIPIANAITASDTMMSLGATVDLIDPVPGETLGHDACAVPAMLAAESWFKGMI